MNWYLDVLKKYAVFNGRARRREFWFYALFNFGIAFALALVDNMLGTTVGGYGVLGLVYGLAVLIPGIAVAIRRLHDTNRSGWWFLLVLIPIAGPLALILFMAQDSVAGENRYGVNPKEALA